MLLRPFVSFLRLLLFLISRFLLRIAGLAERQQDVPDVHGVAAGELQVRDRPGPGAGDLDDGLVGLDVSEHLVLLDGVAGLDLPLDELALGDALPDVGEEELLTQTRRPP